MKLYTVKFNQGWENYNGGEIAGFDAKTAAMLIDKGIASACGKEEAPKEEAPKEEAPKEEAEKEASPANKAVLEASSGPDPNVEASNLSRGGKPPVPTSSRTRKK